MDRNNCGCAPYNPNRTDYLKELNDTCDCVLPCESCECVEQTGTCPPPPACKPVQRIKCCVEKPRKGFWQFIFGGKKCSPSFKKKPDKKRKQVRKFKCVPLPNLKNEHCKDNETQQAASKLDPNSCPRKGCFPTPKSICGCHFYINVEKRTRPLPNTLNTLCTAKNDQQICGTNETPLEYGYNINEEPERDNLATIKEYSENPIDNNTSKEYSANPGRNIKNKRSNPGQNISSPYDKRSDEGYKNIPQAYSEGNKNTPQRYSRHNKSYTANEGRKRSSVAYNPCDGQSRRSTGFSCNGQRKSSLCNRKRHSSVSCLPVRTENPSKNDVHIGLTFTKETKYFIPNKDACLSEQNNSGECKNSLSDDSKENSEQLLTVEIHKSCLKMSPNENVEEVNNHDELNYHKQIKRLPQSESYSRELLPLMKKKSIINGQAIRLSISEDESEENVENTQRRSNKNGSDGCSKANLGKRVSEILKKLNEIENKINIIEKKGQENKKIRLDFDGAKSTVALHIKDPTTENCNNGYKYENSNSKRAPSNTVIEIRHAQSKSFSPVRKSFQENEQRLSESLDVCDKNQPSSHKIVIKLPKVSGKTQCFVLPDKKNNKANENCKETIHWNDISDELKSYPVPPQDSNKCYCYMCVQKRLRCL